jgi:hypothetical protein
LPLEGEAVSEDTKSPPEETPIMGEEEESATTPEVLEPAVEKYTLPKVLGVKRRRGQLLPVSIIFFAFALLSRTGDLSPLNLEAFVYNSLFNPWLWIAVILLRLHFREQKHGVKSLWVFLLYLLFAVTTFFVASGILVRRYL